MLQALSGISALRPQVIVFSNSGEPRISVEGDAISRIADEYNYGKPAVALELLTQAAATADGHRFPPLSTDLLERIRESFAPVNELIAAKAGGRHLLEGDKPFIVDQNNAQSPTTAKESCPLEIKSVGLRIREPHSDMWKQIPSSLEVSWEELKGPHQPKTVRFELEFLDATGTKLGSDHVSGWAKRKGARIEVNPFIAPSYTAVIAVLPEVLIFNDGSRWDSSADQPCRIKYGRIHGAVSY